MRSNIIIDNKRMQEIIFNAYNYGNKSCTLNIFIIISEHQQDHF